MSANGTDIRWYRLTAERGVNNTYLILDWVKYEYFFQKAVPIWAKGRADGMNCELAFPGAISRPNAVYILRHQHLSCLGKWKICLCGTCAGGDGFTALAGSIPNAAALCAGQNTVVISGSL